MTEPAAARPQSPPWGVHDLVLAVSDSLSARFGAVAVRGEISGFTRAASGHCYFNLKDAQGQAAMIRCAMFRRAAALLEFAPADGQQVVLRGRIGLYEPRGELQLVAESLERVGAGSLYEEFLRLRSRLTAQGLFDPARKRPVPPHPAALGVVTSLGAAALRDVLTALARRAPHLRVVVYPCLVQGSDAPQTIVGALGEAGRRREVDTLLLVRGGGSLEDLWAFNDERVVRAVAASAIPVVCGVGHETDVTLADLAADLRAATPTAAAELAAASRDSLVESLTALVARMRRSVRRTLDREDQRQDLIAHRVGRPAAALLAQVHRVEALERSLAIALRQRCARAAQEHAFVARRMLRAAQAGREKATRQLDTLAARLAAAHPEQVLERGFAWLQTPAGVPLTRVASLHPGQHVTAVLADGRARALVEAVEARAPLRVPPR